MGKIFSVKMSVNVITLNNCQACLYMTSVYSLIALEMCDDKRTDEDGGDLRCICT